MSNRIAMIPSVSYFALLRVLVGAFVLGAALLIGITPVSAGTITIVDDPDASPPDSTNSTYSSAYIANYLQNTGSLTIDTANATGGGPNNIEVQENVMITWTSGNRLTLIADANVEINGSFQHDGPANGNGGITVLANHDDSGGGNVLLGSGTQTTAVMVGSRYGLTRVDGDNVYLHAGSGVADAYLLLGFRAFDKDPFYEVTGDISITATSDVTGMGGNGLRGYVQVGNGGANAVDAQGGKLSGEVTMVADDSIEFTTGSGQQAYVQIGNGGRFNYGVLSGNHTLHAVAGDIRMTATTGAAFAQIGNGSETTIAAPTSGNHTVTAGRNILLHGGTGVGAYTMIGNGGIYALGNHTGNHTVTAQSGEIQLYAGNGEASFAQIGNGGSHSNGNHSGDLTIFASTNITVAANDPNIAYAHIGNGGDRVEGEMSGNILLTTQSGDLVMLGGAESSSTAQIGLGGYAAQGDMAGNIELHIGKNLVMEAGGVNLGYVQIGHGDRYITSTGTRDGNITVLVGQDMLLTGAFIGHWTLRSQYWISSGRTWLAVGQNKTLPAGKLQTRTLDPYPTRFRAALIVAGGQLRFYVPTLESVDMANGTLVNGREFTGTIDAEFQGGEFSYPNGPYNDPYRFYVEPKAAVIKPQLFMPLIEP